MRLRAVFADLRTLSGFSDLRRGALVVTFALAERLLAPALAWTLFQHSLRDKVAVTFLLGAVYTARSLAQRSLTPRTEANLVDRTAASVLDADVLRANVLPDEDARFELVQAIYHASMVVSQTLPALVADGVACVLLTGLVLRAEPARVVVFAAALTVVAAGALLVSRRSVENAVERVWKVQRRVYEAFADALEGRLEIVASGLRGAFMADLSARTRAWATEGVRVAAATVLAGRLPAAAIAGLVAAAVLSDTGARRSLPLTWADAALFASVTPAFAGVAQGLHGLTRAERWVGVVARVLRAAGMPRRDGEAPPPLPARIAFEGVTFRYDGSPNATLALDRVEFTWEAESIVALAGPNGSGKSTCLRLLLALGKPAAGAVTVGGTSLDDLDADAWRLRIAFLPQRPYLPPRSDVRRAIRWLAPDASDERMVRALDGVGLLTALRRTGGDPLQVRVDSLSVGQRQRVALARLLCRDAPLVVLDEPDANLDAAGIDRVAGMLRELSRGRMVIFAAHTPELLRAADRVLVLDRGCIVGDRSSDLSVTSTGRSRTK